jgi:ribosomal-protein-alanine N-acetyltransferase
LSELELIALTLEVADALAAGDRSLYGEGGVPDGLARMIADMAGMQAALYRKTGAEEPWIGYLARDPDEQAMVGGCSFVERKDGQVEIAYFTFPGLEGRGIGGRMARALVELAWRDPTLEEIIAHTLPQENASTRILARLGFERAGEAVDPDEGAVWLWRLARSSPSP